jgi:hemoglobin
MQDIQTEQDIELWQNTFYNKLIHDPVTSPKFENLNLPEHMPRIVQFWAFVLLEKEGYKTNVFEKHMHLNLEKKHFDKWLTFFFETTNEMFSGPNAEIAKQRVKLLATTFMHKINGEYDMFEELNLK